MHTAINAMIVLNNPLIDRTIVPQFYQFLADVNVFPMLEYFSGAIEFGLELFRTKPQLESSNPIEPANPLFEPMIDRFLVTIDMAEIESHMQLLQENHKDYPGMHWLKYVLYTVRHQKGLTKNWREITVAMWSNVNMIQWLEQAVELIVDDDTIQQIDYLFRTILKLYVGDISTALSTLHPIDKQTIEYYLPSSKDSYAIMHGTVENSYYRPLIFADCAYRT